MRAMKWLLLGIVGLVVAFTFIPTSVSVNSIIDAQRTMSVGTIQRTNQAELSAFQTSQLYQTLQGNNGSLSESDAKDLRQRIVDRGVYIANTLGNGPRDAPRSGSQFYYDRAAAGYGTFKELDDNIAKMLTDSSKRCDISCIACATYCWQWAMQDVPNLYWCGCSAAVGRSAYGAVLEGDGTVEYIKEHGQPGDLIFFTADYDAYNAYANYRFDGENPHYKYGAWAHAELYIGPYKDEALGSDMAYACVASNEPGHDWNIKDVGTHDGRKVYLCSLAKYIEFCGLDEAKYYIGAGQDTGSLTGENDVNQGGT